MNLPAIICVDDEKTILDSLRIELEAAFGDKYLIEMVQDGEEALEVISELLKDEHEVAVVIADYIMPDMKGDELLRRIHTISPKTLKIMLTGQADVEAVGNAIKHAKLYRYIAKPWQTEDLSLTVKEAVNSYLKEKKLAEQNVQLQQMNQELAQLNHKQAELIAQLQESKNQLTQFIEAMQVAVFVVDANGQPYYANQTAQQILGKGMVSVVNSEQLSEIYQVYLAGTDRLYPSDRNPLLRALQGESSTIDDMEIRRPDKTIPIEAWGMPIYDEAGNIAYAVTGFQDITERKQAETERLKFTHELFLLNQAFSRFVPHQFLHLLNKKSLVDVQLGDQVQQEMSVLFSDIRDFTAFSERMTPQENFKFINAYLKRMEPAIIENQGFIDKYMGDGIMALFSGSADDAVKAGIAMLQNLTQYNQQLVKEGYVPIKIGIGINTGSLMLGTVGGLNRMDSTVISDDVNLASRLEGLTKQYGVSLLISQQTLACLHNPMEYCIRFIGQVTVKGKSKAVAVFEVFDGDDPETIQDKLATKAVFEEGVFLHYQQAFREAAKRFAAVLSINPSDRVAQIYLERSRSQELKIRPFPLWESGLKPGLQG